MQDSIARAALIVGAILLFLEAGLVLSGEVPRLFAPCTDWASEDPPAEDGCERRTWIVGSRGGVLLEVAAHSGWALLIVALATASALTRRALFIGIALPVLVIGSFIVGTALMVILLPLALLVFLLALLLLVTRRRAPPAYAYPPPPGGWR